MTSRAVVSELEPDATASVPRVEFFPSPVFVALALSFALSGLYLWTAKGVARIVIFLFVLLGWVVSLCLHEFAHAAVAYVSGDRGVAAKGYLTLNPLRYARRGLSVGLPVLFVLLGGVGLPGAAVYVDRSKLKDRWASCLVSAAGPAANLAAAFAAFSPFLIFGQATLARHPQFEVACAALGVLEVVAVILNLLPIPPLDGFGIIEAFFADPRRGPRRASAAFLPVVLVMLMQPAGPARVLWRTAYRVGYAAGVPHGAASEGLQLYRFWAKAPKSSSVALQPPQGVSLASSAKDLSGAQSWWQHLHIPMTSSGVVVSPNVNRVVSGGSKPLFELSGSGSQTSPAFVLSTTRLIGGAQDDGPLTVWIVPASTRPSATDVPYYVNDGAGDGGASATLSSPGRYVVVVKATNPKVHWAVDIADLDSPES